MRNHTQLKKFLVRMLISLIALTALGQGTGARQSSLKLTPAIVLPHTIVGAQAKKYASPPGGEGTWRVTQPPKKEQPATSPGVGTPVFLPVVTYDTGGYQANSVVVADVNGDGIPDLVVVNCGDCYGPPSITHGSSVAVLLGNGDGTFQSAVTYSSGGQTPLSAVVADVNGDGKPDLVVVNRCGNNGCLNDSLVSVLLGNGDGTFKPAQTHDTGGLFSSSVAVADVNGDGKPDLIVGNKCADSNCDGSVAVLLGKGDGTFQAASTYLTGGIEAFFVAVADVNGDGRPDLLAGTNLNPVGAVAVLLGHGDGTFQSAVSYASGGLLGFYGSGGSLVVADVDKDGKLDLVVENNECCRSANGSVGILLGNGDGTFKKVVTYKSGAGGPGTSAVLADVNGDGKLDLVATDYCAASNCINEGLAAVLLGNGDGTFQAAVTYSSGGFLTNSVAVADLNGDGKPDLVVANQCADNSSVCAQTSVGVLLNNTITGSPTAATLTSSPNPSRVGQAVTFTAAVSSSAGIPPNGEIITFNNGSAALGTAPLSGGTTSLVVSSLPVGTFTITARYPGDANFVASTSPGLKQVVNPTGKFATSTSLISSLNPSIYGQKMTWTAAVTTSGSVAPTGTVKFTWSDHTIGSATLNSSGVATLTRSNLNADPYPLTAVYVGDAANLGSTSPALNQVVVETTSSATLTSSPNPSTHSQAVTFTAKITSPTVVAKGPVTFTAGKTVLGTAQLSGGVAKLTISSLAVGSTKVTATYYGDSNISQSSASVTQTVH